MKDTESKKNILLTGWLLALFALVGTGILAVVNSHSKPYISEHERQMLLRSLNSVIPADGYNNDIINDTILMFDQKLLGNKESKLVYRARKGTSSIAAVLTVTAPNGYSGPIVLLVGIKLSGQISGVRVIKHSETPGLGDGIEIQRNNWIDSFTNKSLINPGDNGWKVKRDGGEFDQLTGATITPRAVVAAVHKAIIFFENNRQQIFEFQSTKKDIQI